VKDNNYLVERYLGSGIWIYRSKITFNETDNYGTEITYYRGYDKRLIRLIDRMNLSWTPVDGMYIIRYEEFKELEDSIIAKLDYKNYLKA